MALRPAWVLATVAAASGSLRGSQSSGGSTVTGVLVPLLVSAVVLGVLLHFYCVFREPVESDDRRSSQGSAEGFEKRRTVLRARQAWEAEAERLRELGKATAAGARRWSRPNVPSARGRTLRRFSSALTLRRVSIASSSSRGSASGGAPAPRKLIKRLLSRKEPSPSLRGVVPDAPTFDESEPPASQVRTGGGRRVGFVVVDAPPAVQTAERRSRGRVEPAEQPQPLATLLNQLQELRAENAAMKAENGFVVGQLMGQLQELRAEVALKAEAEGACCSPGEPSGAS